MNVKQAKIVAHFTDLLSFCVICRGFHTFTQKYPVSRVLVTGGLKAFRGVGFRVVDKKICTNFSY